MQNPSYSRFSTWLLKILGTAFVISLFLNRSVYGADQAVPGQVYTVAWSPDGTKIAVGGGTFQCNSSDLQSHSIRIIDSVSNQLLNTLEGHRCQVVNLAWSPDGSKLVSGSADGVARVWNVITGQTISRADEGANLDTRTGQVWSPNGQRIADFYESSRKVNIWDALSGLALITYEASEVIDSVTWSPDGTKLAIGIWNAIQIVDSTNGTLLARLC